MNKLLTITLLAVVMTAAFAVPCDPAVDHCKVCKDDKKTCDQCNEGYQLSTTDNKCNKIDCSKLTNCDLCSSDTTCLTCSADYQIKEGKCVAKVKCNDDTCEECSDASTCTKCKDATNVIAEGKCYKKCEKVPEGCTTCVTKDDKPVCLDCKVDKCTTCEFGNSTACKTCNAEYVVSTKSHQCYSNKLVDCEKGVKNCEKCESDKKKCGICDNGFRVVEGSCKACISSCEVCKDEKTCERCKFNTTYNASTSKCGGVRTGITIGAIAVSLIALLF